MLKFYIPEVTEVDEVKDELDAVSEEQFEKLEQRIRVKEIPKKNDWSFA